MLLMVLTRCKGYPSYTWTRPCINMTGVPFNSPNTNCPKWPGTANTNKFQLPSTNANFISITWHQKSRGCPPPFIYSSSTYQYWQETRSVQSIWWFVCPPPSPRVRQAPTHTRFQLWEHAWSCHWSAWPKPPPPQEILGWNKEETLSLQHLKIRFRVYCLNHYQLTTFFIWSENSQQKQTGSLYSMYQL